ncbi:hypothetical protein MA16_Dca012152 [Dendrobium catenatum]|uniref:Uncharacterized protein n=1 Tax=Dendrobium catenatum TaxID=906689 RepID=A0A2I0VF95_9ASPA|nr:hypothetical protein MA16_Dca012152 [Dendrobium catenatum]
MLLTTTCTIHDYYVLYVCKSPCMTSAQTGDKWVCELLHGHPNRFHNMFKMSQVIFIDLLSLLELSYGLHESRRTTTREVLAITLYILGHNESIRSTCECFQHSIETISRFFYISLQALVQLSVEIIAPIDTRYMPYFKDCIDATDGTQVDARIHVEEHVAYIERHHSPTQNVMIAYDFNMCFTFVSPSWEGSTHDARIFKHVVMDPKYNFHAPPPGKFYLVDAGCPLQMGYLKSYLGTRYHIADFRRGSRTIMGHEELFNSRHSSLRSVIERSFGV